MPSTLTYTRDVTLKKADITAAPRNLHSSEMMEEYPVIMQPASIAERVWAYQRVWAYHVTGPAHCPRSTQERQVMVGQRCIQIVDQRCFLKVS